MNFKPIFQWADNLVFAKTGKHLTSLQQTILEGVLSSQKYGDIAKNFNCSENHVKRVASELWQIFSESLGEDINKSNFRATVDRLQVYNLSNSWQDSIQINSVNFCADTLHSTQLEKISNTENQPPTKPQKSTNIPPISKFYGRINELIKLKTWICQDHCRVVTILGICGIGKTTLSRYLVSQITDNFNAVIWCSLRTSPSLDALLKILIKSITNQPKIELPAHTEEKLSILIDYLRSQRYLIILDDVQTILQSEKLVGNYRPNYENYGTFFQVLCEAPHQSCLILKSWEAPREIIALTGENFPVRSLYLQGLGIAAKEILRSNKLQDEAQWEKLIQTYQGHPLWLKFVADMIRDLFGGKVGEFIKYDALILGEDLLASCTKIWQRLSANEKKIMVCLSEQNCPVGISQLLENVPVSGIELLNILQSLSRRELIEKPLKTREVLFTVPPVIKYYTNFQASHK
ncbi:MAG: NB-ARC domain-containing protein [Microcoleaceae cyanobacterium]